MEFLLKASAITALFYICYKLFLQRETFFESNRWFLLSGLALSIGVPFLVIPIYIENISISNFVIANENSSSQPLIEDAFNYLKILPLLYGIGVIFFLTKLGIEFSSLFKLLNSTISKSSQTTTYIETEDNVSPFSFFNYIVYNPKQFNATELEHILNHEKVHAKQWHSLDILIAQLATIVFWFNPFIWLYKKDLQQNLEFIADQNAQRVSSCQKSYQHLLLKATVTNQHLVLVNNFYNSLIKKRIVMLHKSKSHKLNVLKYALVIPLLGLFLMSFNTKEIFLEPDSASTVIDLGDIEMVIITKDFKDADFEKIKTEFKNKGVALKFKGIKRNNNGEIIAIKIDASTSKSNANYNISADDAIKPIKITYNSDDYSISIGNGKAIHGENYYFKTAGGKTKIHQTHGKEKNSSHVYVISEEHEEHEVHDSDEGHKDHNVEVIIEDEGGKNENVYIIKNGKDGKKIKEKINLNDDGTHTWIEEENEDAQKKHEITVIDRDKNEDDMLFISSDGNESPLIIIDDKESTMEAMENLNPNSIDKMNVLKEKMATNIYGEKGKHGVIIITTKKH